eukprot:CAMPEP_0198266626 /NCGR_PEP_ID=MMETSP1447-20131203/29341_1 /TAXON_ID=420782 /ORGANISM="Chaetoceros dichaeta, Strain CCMP1751" /LENGTH=318 /DNA_ID=CAMNT_0043956825 /DNA_START=55 /DNA_END=1007 /DNA_ORIENTATION=-
MIRRRRRTSSSPNITVTSEGTTIPTVASDVDPMIVIAKQRRSCRYNRTLDDGGGVICCVLILLLASSITTCSCWSTSMSFIPTRRRIHSHIHSSTSSSSLRMSNDGVLTNSEIGRYSRHLVLSDVGMSGQSALKKSSVLVIGAGGLGSPCLMYLAAAGVGHIGIVDGDTVDESNLQRQIIHGTSTIHKSKCQSALQRLQDINPNVHIRTYEEEFTSASAMRILTDGFSPDSEWDIVVDGSDNFPTKYLINDACELTGLPWVYAAILAFEGQISVFNYCDGAGVKGPTYRDMIPTPPPPGDVPSCAEGGVLGVLPGTMG